MAGAKNTLKHCEGLYTVACAWTEPPWFQFASKSWIFEDSSWQVFLIQKSDSSEALFPLLLKRFWMGESRLSTSASPEHCSVLSSCGLENNSMHYWVAINVCIFWMFVTCKTTVKTDLTFLGGWRRSSDPIQAGPGCTVQICAGCTAEI